MRAVFNTPGADQPVAIRDAEEPSPARDEFLLRVAAFSINRGELSLIKFRPEGWRPGQDVAGTVVKAAANGEGPAVGDRVVGIVENSGWAERVPVRATRYAALADNVSFEQAASLPIAGMTALRTLRLAGDLLGRRVLITGANGAVGRFQIELAAHAGAEVTAVTTRDDQAGALHDIGARAVVGSVDQAGGTFRLILESVGGELFEEAVRKLEPRGTIVPLGLSSGQSPTFNLFDFLGREGARVQTFMSYASGYPDDADLATLVNMVSEGTLHPTLGHVGPWDGLIGALEMLAERKLVGGKIILTVDEAR